MDVSIKFGLFVLIIAGVIFAFWRWTSTSGGQKPVYPRGPRKYVANSYQEEDRVAKLLTDVSALKARGAQWPDILKTLNPHDEPQIRTVLLEIRAPHVFAPNIALNIIESICLEAKKPTENQTRLTLLEAAKSSMERVTQYGN